jgi:endonuclease YncB( thermonuclease family)
VNAPELHSKNPKEVKAATAAKAAVEEILKMGPLTVHSQKPAGELEADKYGRWLCSVDVHLPDGKTLDLATELISRKLAVPYDGGHRTPWTDD